LTRFGTRTLLRLGRRTLSWNARLLATLLLFVGPAHAAAQQISAEHLPTASGELIDGARADKPVLRADPGFAFCLICADTADDGIVLLPVGTGPLASRILVLASGSFTPARAAPSAPYGFAWGRAPPLA